MSYFSLCLSRFVQTLANDRQEIKNIDSCAVFIKNENEFLEISDFCHTWSKDHYSTNVLNFRAIR